MLNLIKIKKGLKLDTTDNMEDFDKWLEDFNAHYVSSKSWQSVQRYGQNQKDLLGWYIQYKNGRDTRSLVKATWILAISTIILAIATIALVFVA